jgi:hypothetical protein
MHPRNISIAIYRFLLALSLLRNENNVSPGDLMRIISNFLCANLASEGDNATRVARYIRDYGLSIDDLLLQEVYPGSNIELGQEFNGMFTLVAGTFSILVTYRAKNYRIVLAWTMENGKYFSIEENGVEVFLAKLVYSDSERKKVFEIWKKPQSSVFASLSQPIVPTSASFPSLPSASTKATAPTKAPVPTLASVPTQAPPALPTYSKVFWDDPRNWADEDSASGASASVASASGASASGASASVASASGASASGASASVASASGASASVASGASASGASAPTQETPTEKRKRLIDLLKVGFALKQKLKKSDISLEEIEDALASIDESTSNDDVKVYFEELLSMQGSSSA